MTKKGILFLTFVIACLFMLHPVTSLAATNDQPALPTEGTPAGQSGSETAGDVIIQSTLYFKSGESGIYQEDQNTVQVSGYTETYSSVDVISVKLYVQYWDQEDRQWKDAGYLGEFKKTNDDYVSGIKTVDVNGGFYYRTRAVHTVEEGGMQEKVTSYSNYIYME
ncbi:MAG: hypothetical protein H0Z33_14540 [Bacillaceae bacterium]|nr:hypothetical protein [Bacillaceae bacterium]